MTVDTNKIQQDKYFQRKHGNFTNFDVVTLVQDLNAKIDALQRGQANLKLDIVKHIERILLRRWSVEDARHRERSW